MDKKLLMEDKHFKILEFLSRQTRPILVTDFPEEIQTMFETRMPLKEGSLFMELEVKLNHAKKWIDSTRHNFIITENGRIALEKEEETRRAKEHRESMSFEKLTLEIQDLRNKFFDYDQTKARAIRAEFCAIIAAILSAIMVALRFMKY